MKRRTVVATALTIALAMGVGAYRARAGDPSRESSARSNAETTSAKDAQGEDPSSAGHSHARASLHGGMVTMTKESHFETVFTPEGIRVFRYSASQAPLMIKAAAGAATLVFADGTKREIPFAATKPATGEPTVYFCPMHEEVVQSEPGQCAPCGGMKLFAQDYLFAKADLSSVETGTLKATIHLTNLGGKETEATFTQNDARTETTPPATH
jgi:hypothetical protein